MLDTETRNRRQLALDDVSSHWGLRRDPFMGTAATYIPIPTHERAMDRLGHLIESGQSLGVLSGEPGLGKSMVLGQLARKLKSPTRRFVPVNHPLDGVQFISGLASALRIPPFTGSDSPTLWRSIDQSLRLQSLQQTHLVVVVDECASLLSESEVSPLKRLLDLARGASTKLSVVLASVDEFAVRQRPEFNDALPARLTRLTRAETAAYLVAKLYLGGRKDEVFTPRSITRLHALSGGVPRSLDLLASQSLRAGAELGHPTVTPEVVDEVGRDLSPSSDFLVRA